MDNIGCLVGQRLVAALVGNGISYEDLVKIVYGELSAIETEQVKGDWLTMPNGKSYVKE